MFLLFEAVLCLKCDKNTKATVKSLTCGTATGIQSNAVFALLSTNIKH
jgi:hypothetical protein